MSADEISKLAELRDKGVITEKEFKNRKSAILRGSGAKKRRGLWWKLPITLLFVVFVIAIISSKDKNPAVVSNSKNIPATEKPVTVSDGSSSLPKCDSNAAFSTAKQAVEQNRFSNSDTLKLLGLHNTTEVSFNSDKSERYCKSTAMLNAGEYQITFKIFKRDSKIYVFIDPIEEN